MRHNKINLNTENMKEGMKINRTETIITNNGNVTLYGKAGNAAEFDLATKLARDVNGVESVNNRMTIKVVRAQG
ncbi:MAG: BON domain-containing protein [Proteobacteria bacterium]|nr:BON domain-containing protein [Pseudomonadota bacterium]